MFFRSIKWRLQLWHGAILMLVLGGFGYTAFELQRTRESRRLDQELQDRMGTLQEAFRPGPPPGFRRRRDFQDEGPGRPRHILPFPPLDAELPGPEPFEPVFPQFPPGPVYHVIWRRDGRVIRSAGAPPDVPRPEPRSPPGLRTRGEYRELEQSAPRGDSIVVGRSMGEMRAEFRRLGWLLAGSGSAILLLGLAGGWWVATRAMAPIDKISAAAVKIASGDLSSRIASQETESELGRLASVLNSTFERLEAAFNEQAQFTIDVSHELRTPVTVVLSQTQMTLGRDRSPAEYKETIEACQRAAQRMRRMIEALLQLARLDAGQEIIRRESFDLAAVARETASMLAPLAAERELRLVTACESAVCTGDAEKMGQVLTNLLVNALHYTPAQGEIRIRTESIPGFAICRVEDTGPGIPPEDLPHIFNRFYRVERSRSREKGGTGLGLAISRAIVHAHGGSLEVASVVNQGTTFTVRLPA